MLMRVVGLGFAMLVSGRNVTGSGSDIYDKGYYLMIKSYSSVVVVKFTTKAFYYTILGPTNRYSNKKRGCGLVA
jgi:hypothetical protein